MFLDYKESAQAVMVFDDTRVVREMLYREFEAILDEIVPAMEWSDQRLNAVYIEINSRLQVTKAVFFILLINSEGFIDKTWNLPLLELARSAGKGPDLGAGPIRLACASQCPIDFCQQLLWNPEISARSSHLKALQKAVSNNRLALQFKTPEEEETPAGFDFADAALYLEKKITQELRRDFEKSFRDRMAQRLKEQRFRLSNLQARHEQSIRELKLEHSQRLAEYRELIEKAEKDLEQEKSLNRQLKEDIEGQAEKIGGLREYFEHKLAKVQGEESEQLRMLQENYQLELDSKIQAAVTEYKELLQIREVELHYRNEQESQLRDEISRLRQENQQLFVNSGDQLLEKITSSGIRFVTYHPGAGHMTIALDDVARYMENPLAYTAQYCGVSQAHYESWLEHYQTPICQAVDDDGVCSANIERVETPADFVLDESDCCKKHRKINGRPPMHIVNG